MYVNNLEVWSCRIYTKFNDQVAINVLNYVIGSTLADQVTDLEAAADIAVHLATEFKACISSAATFQGVGLQRRSPAPPGQEALSAVGAGVGGVTGDPLPRQVAGLLSFKTQYAGPRYRGRMYIPFPGESDNDTDTTPTASAITRFDALLDKVIANVNLTGAVGNALAIPVIRSRKFGTYEQILGGVVRDNWATQQRRGAFGPKNISPF